MGNAYCMRDSDLTERPGRGWTRWAEGPVDLEIDRVWWAARVLHFAKLNVSTWFDGSEIVGIEHWGYREPKWTMRITPADWEPMPAGYRAAAESAWQEWRAEQQHRRPSLERTSGMC
jgi:hypothetical protein